MTLVSPSQSNPNDEITAAAINTPVNQIAAVINGNIDNTNISSVSGAKIQAGTVAAGAMDTNSNPETRMSESLGNFVASGCVWSLSSGLVGTMTAGVVYIGGKRVIVNAIATQTFLASKDTYVSVDNTGAVSIASAVANGATAPTLPANSLWLFKVVTSASAITSTVDIRTFSQSQLAIRYKDNVTDSVQPTTFVQTGWGFITGTGATFVNKAVTFPIPFSSSAIVLCSPIGYKDTTDPTSPSDFAQYEEIHMAVGAANAAGFTATGKYIGGTAMASTRRFGFSWVAIGK
jgi:hypothetical protein